MSHPIRIEFPDALYHFTARGDRREDIVDDDVDRQAFLDILGQVVEQFNWVCYAWCLRRSMGSDTIINDILAPS